MATYVVMAGNNVGMKEQCKHVQSFTTLEEALAYQDSVSDNPWYRIVIREGDFEYAIEPRRIRKKIEGDHYMPCTPKGTLIQPDL
ncbi:hypothetical protein ACI2KR_06785 [Pseudomonas luteola]